jgi:RHS repeat-associated protein
VTRTFDAYGQLQGDNVSAGSFGCQAAISRDSAGRQAALGFGAFGYNYSWRADGLLASASGGSYTYDTAGQILTRAFSPMASSVTQRDGVGRPLVVSTTVNGSSALNETLTWTGDGLVASHTVARPDYTNYQSYSYAPLSRRLTQEILGLSANTTWTNTFGYDGATAGGPGVLTGTGEAPGANSVTWQGGTDAFSRVNAETNSVAQRQAYGQVNGTATVTALLDGNPMPVTTIGTNAMQWRAQLDLLPGAHQLIVNAVNWSGYYTASATNSFTNNAADHVQETYSADGEVTGRVWLNSSGQTNRVQSLSWDAKGRLHSVTDLDSTTSGYTWTAVYDGFGRRLQTTTIMETNGISISTLPQIINQYYDPGVEFLELAVAVNGVLTYKVYGPDANGVYGGMNGVGGLEAVCTYGQYASPIISDIRGDGLAAYQQNSLNWYPSRPSAFGAIPGYRPLPLGAGAGLAEASASGGKWSDITGLEWHGCRYYDPINGCWMSYDPSRNDRDPNGYTYCGGNPIGYRDPDGRCANPVGQMANNPFSPGYQAPYDGPSMYAASAPSSSFNNSFQMRDAAGSFIDQLFNNVVLSLATPHDYTIGPLQTTPDALYQAAIANVAQQQFGSPLAQNGVYNPNSSGAVWGTVAGDVVPVAATFYGGTRAIMGDAMIGQPAPVLSQLSQGVDYEAQQLATLNLTKNTTVFQPTSEQVQSAAFQVIVGPPQYTPGGNLVGTISDSTQGGLLEIKSGSSTLNSSYQLRLQTYNSVVNNVPLTIQTTRPVNPTFMNYLQNWGVTVRPPANP